MTIEERLRDLERRVTRVEQLLHETPPSTVDERAINRPPQDKGPESAAPAVRDDASGRAEHLLDELLSMSPPRLVSYSEAYRRIIGPYSVWRNAVHAPEVVQIARHTSPRHVGRLTVRLDSLIVGKETRRPAGGHFSAADYSEADWIQTFGTWPLLA